MPKPIEKQEVSLSEAMRLTKYTKQNLQKLIEAGHLQRKDRATFELGELMQAVMTHLRTQRKTAERTVAHERLLTARAEEIEQRNRVREGKLIETDEHLSIMELILGTLKSTIESMPAQISRDPEFRRRGDKVVFDALTKCSHDLARLTVKAQGEAAGVTTPNEPEEEHD